MAERRAQHGTAGRARKRVLLTSGARPPGTGWREHGPPSPPGCRVPSVGSSLQGPSGPSRQVGPPPAAPCTPGLGLEVKVKPR